MQTIHCAKTLAREGEVALSSARIPARENDAMLRGCGTAFNVPYALQAGRAPDIAGCAPLVAPFFVPVYYF